MRPIGSPVHKAYNRASQHPFIVSVEGIAGCGKSSTIRHVLNHLNCMGLKCAAYKLGGLGESRRGVALKRIRAARQEAARAGTETGRQEDDRKRGRVYALALRAQSRQLEELIAQRATDIILLDRSPFMNSVHLRAEDSVYPEGGYSYADEVFEKELSVAQQVGIIEVILMDVTAEVAIARLIYRYCGAAKDQIVAAINRIEAPPSRRAEIAEQAMRLFAKAPNVVPQPLDTWHLATPIEVVDCERREFVRSLGVARDRIGLAWSVVDAHASADALADRVTAIVQSRLYQ